MAGVSSFGRLTLPTYIKGISDALIADNVLLRRLKAKNRIKFNCGGDGWQKRVRVRTANIGGAVAGDNSRGNAKTVSPFEYIYGSYRPYLWRLFENALALDRNQYAPDASKIADQQEEDLATIQQEAEGRIGAHLYSTGDSSALLTGDETGSTPVMGLDGLIASSGTYFGLARATYTALNSQVQACANPSQWDNNLVNNLVVALDALWVACAGGKQTGEGIPKNLATSKDMPDVLISGATLFNVYSQALQPQQRYTEKDADSRKVLLYAGIPYEWDSVCTSARVFMLNAASLQVLVVGPQMLRIIKTIEKDSPVGTVSVLAAQLEQYSPDPRKHGKVTTTGS